MLGDRLSQLPMRIDGQMQNKKQFAVEKKILTQALCRENKNSICHTETLGQPHF